MAEEITSLTAARINALQSQNTREAPKPAISEPDESVAEVTPPQQTAAQNVRNNLERQAVPSSEIETLAQDTRNIDEMLGTHIDFFA